MSPLEAFGIIAGVASIVGVILALRHARYAAARAKDLRYNSTRSRFPIVSQRPLEEYGISISYETGETKETIDKLYVHYLTVANLGYESIRHEDQAPSNPLRIEVEGDRTLDISLQATTRDVIKFSLGPTQHPEESKAVAAVTFDYLDRGDGALVRVLTSGQVSSIALKGDIVGMPSGVRPIEQLSTSGVVGKVGVAASVLFYLSALAVTPIVYRWVTGAWENVWVLVLPLVAIILPGVVIATVSATVWPSPQPVFPRKIWPPRLAIHRLIEGEEEMLMSAYPPHFLHDIDDASD